MRRPALAIWNVSDGQMGSNVRPVVILVIHGVFRPDHACWNVVSVATKSALQQAQLCTERGNLYLFGSGLHTW